MNRESEPTPAPELLSVVTVDIDPAVEDEFNEWYDERHVGEVLACPGWLWGARYMSTTATGPKYMAMYEMESEAAMWTPELQAIKGFGKYWKSLDSYTSQVYRRTMSARQ